MNIDLILEVIKPRPPFWLRVWLFFFLLINRKEGKRLFETLIEEVAGLEKAYHQANEKFEKAAAVSAETNRKLAEMEKRERETGHSSPVSQGIA